MEIYSIDEAFLCLRGLAADPVSYCKSMRDTVRTHTGIPVSVGIAPTKTLAKLGSKIAKRDASRGGVARLDPREGIDEILAGVPAGDIWGVGPRYSEMLARHGIYNALQLARAEDRWVKKKMTITGLRMVLELRGIPCIPLDEAPSPKKEIVSSRSFGRPVETRQEIGEALASYTARAAEKLRAQRSAASCITVFLMTDRFKPVSQYSNAAVAELPAPASDTSVLVHFAFRLLESIYRNGYLYKKAGVMLSGLVPENEVQLSLFTGRRDRPGLMKVMDGINARRGRNTVYFAAEGVTRPWHMRREFLSPRYTTEWSEIPVVRS